MRLLTLSLTLVCFTCFAQTDLAEPDFDDRPQIPTSFDLEQAPNYGRPVNPTEAQGKAAKEKADRSGRNLMQMHNSLHNHFTLVRLIRQYGLEVELDLSNKQVDELNAIDDPDFAAMGTTIFGGKEKTPNPYDMDEEEFAKILKRLERRVSVSCTVANTEAEQILRDEQLQRCKQLGFQLNSFVYQNLDTAFLWHDESIDASLLHEINRDFSRIRIDKYKAKEIIGRLTKFEIVRDAIGSTSFRKLAGDTFPFSSDPDLVVRVEEILADETVLKVPAQERTEFFAEYRGPSAAYSAIVTMPGVKDELGLTDRLVDVGRKHRDLWTKLPPSTTPKLAAKRSALVKQMADTEEEVLSKLTAAQKRRIRQLQFQVDIISNRITPLLKERGIELSESKAINLDVDLRMMPQRVYMNTAKYAYLQKLEVLKNKLGETRTSKFVGEPFLFVEQRSGGRYGPIRDTIDYVDMNQMSTLKERKANPRRDR